MKSKVKNATTLVKKAHEYFLLATVSPRTIEEYRIVFSRIKKREVEKKYATLIIHRLKKAGLVDKVGREHIVKKEIFNEALSLNPVKVGILDNPTYRAVFEACGNGAEIEAIMTTTGYNENQVRRSLYMLQKAGLVGRDESYYQLPFNLNTLTGIELLIKS